MRNIFLLIGNCMAGFMDIGVGAFIAALMAHALDIEVGIALLAFGAICGFLPDIPVIVAILKGASSEVIQGHHRWLTHRPSFMFATVTILTAILSERTYAAIAFVCLLWHFVHDTPPIGVGKVLNWRWPWGKDPPDLNYETHTGWIESTWLRPSGRSTFEIGTGGVALVVALVLGGYATLAVFAATCTVAGTILVWFLWLKFK